MPNLPMMLTDTGTTITYLTPSDFDNLLPKMCPNCEFDKQHGLYFKRACTWEDEKEFHPLWFLLDN